MSEINKQVNKKLFLQITTINEHIRDANHPSPGWRPLRLKDLSENFHLEKRKPKEENNQNHLSNPPLDFPSF